MSPRRVLAVMLSPLLSAIVVAQVLQVPSQYATIGAALAAAPSGATILVAAGIYVERLTWPARDGIRLVAESGPANTILDGNAGGTVISFTAGYPAPLSRATLIEGFTIRNGRLTGSQNFGAGIYVYDTSPTIRGNRLTGHTSIGDRNCGGAIYVGGLTANPRIEANEITNNSLFDGNYNFGAGIYVGSSAGAEVVGNRIHQNHCGMLVTTNVGRGHGAGVYVSSRAVVASNFVYNNLCDTNGWNYGAGLHCSPTGGTTTILNNTIVGNVVQGGYWNYGGGVYLQNLSIQGAIQLRGNIVVQNLGDGIYVYSPVTIPPSSDFDNVWGNVGPAYTGMVPGPNSTSDDPQFVGPSDLHLQAGSRCIDAMPATWLPTTVAIDGDGDPRRLDGDLDGGATNGARLDLGADEHSLVRLEAQMTPQLGGVVLWSVTGPANSMQLFAVGFGRGNTFHEPYGNLLLGAPAWLVGIATVPGYWALGIPTDPGLRGVVMLGQALVLPPAQLGGQLTNAAQIRIY